MAQRALIWHLFPVYLLVVISSLLAVVGFSASSLWGFYHDQVAVDLQARAALIQEQVKIHVLTRDDDALQKLCSSLGESSQTRITVLLPSGEVLADSEETPSSMENHVSRPEIRDAYAGGVGQSIRYSTTLNQRMMYVAVSIRDGSKSIGILRVALPTTAIEDTLWSLLIKLAYGGIVVSLVAAMVSWFVSHRITAPLKELRQGAEKFSVGELGHQLSIQHSLEIDALADSMNSMALELGERMDTVTHQNLEQEAVLSSMVEGVLAVDVDGKLISINQSASELFDINAESFIGLNVSEFIRNTVFNSFIHNTIESDGPTSEEITFHADETKLYDVHGTVLKSKDGQRVGAVVVLHDVTDIRKLERVRSEFVSNVSHELRTPITSIKGFIETLLETPPVDEAETKHFLQIISKNATQLNTLIGDLLSLSRIEQGELIAGEVMQVCSLRTILLQARESCLPAADSKDVDVHIDFENSLELYVHQSLIQQAVTNLMDNAIKYSPQNKTVEVTAKQDAEYTTIQVTDYGVGIAPEHLPRLFERFYRVDKARSRELGGTGLGLSIVKHICELHGGSVGVDSELGSFSSFYINIPTNAQRS